MERGRERRALANGDDPTRARFGGENLDCGPCLLDPWCADEDGVERRAGRAGEGDGGPERLRAAAARSARRCSATSPCSASTPIAGASLLAGTYQPRSA